MKKLFIFDFDGTLADTKTLVKQGIYEFSKEKSLPIPDIDLICYGYSNPDNYDFQWGVGKEKQKEIMNEAFIYVSEKIESGEYIPSLFPNTIELLNSLKKHNNTLAICTSREKDPCIKVLQHHDIYKYFNVLKTREDLTIRNKKEKPNPALIFEIIEETNIDKNKTFMIGDTDADILAAKNAGIKSIGVSWGYFTKEKLENCFADYIVDDFLDVMELLK